MSRVIGSNPDHTHPRVLVRGDGAVKFGAAVMLLDEVRAAGIKAVSVETRLEAVGR